MQLAGLIGSIEHPVCARQIMDRAEHKIETIPMGFDPPQPAFAGYGIIVQFNPLQNLKARIHLSQPIDHIEVHPFAVPVVICERYTFDTSLPASIDPGLQELDRVGTDRVALWVGVVITIATHGNDR